MTYPTVSLNRKPDKLCYIAGPYRADDVCGVEANILAAKRTAIAMHRATGMAPVIPHMNTALLDVHMPEAPDEFWLRFGLELLSRCDAIWMIDGWERSAGSWGELELAVSDGMEIWINGTKTMISLEELIRRRTAAEGKEG